MGQVWLLPNCLNGGIEGLTEFDQPNHFVMSACLGQHAGVLPHGCNVYLCCIYLFPCMNKTLAARPTHGCTSRHPITVVAPGDFGLAARLLSQHDISTAATRQHTVLTWHSCLVQPGHLKASSGAAGDVRSTVLSVPGGSSKSSGTLRARLLSSRLLSDCVTLITPVCTAAFCSGVAAAAAAAGAGCSGLTTLQQTCCVRRLLPWLLLPTAANKLQPEPLQLLFDTSPSFGAVAAARLLATSAAGLLAMAVCQFVCKLLCRAIAA